MAERLSPFFFIHLSQLHHHPLNNSSEGGDRLELNLNLKQTDRTESVRKAVRKEQDKAYQPTWSEVWLTGYTTPTGAHKKGIMQTSMTDADRYKLDAVREAIESGEIGTFCEDLRKFSKSHAMKLYQLLKESRRESTIKHIVDNTPANYHLIQTVEKYRWMLNQIQQEKHLSGFIGLDTETTGLEWYGKDVICGFNVSLPDLDQHFYVPLRHNTTEQQLPAQWAFQQIKPLLEDSTLGKVLHNAKFDAHMLYKESIELQGIIMDTMLSMFVLSENELSYALKNIATKWGRFFGFADESATYEELFGRGGFENTPLDIATVYACKDTHLTVRLSQWIQSHLDKQEGLARVNALETRLIPVTISMERNGFSIDLDYAKQYEYQLQAEVDELERQIHEAFGGINVNSPDQLKHKLYVEMGLPDRKKGSVDAEALEDLRDDCDAVGLLVDYREKTKLLKTYIIPLPDKISKLDNRLHGQLKQNGAKTGRYSSSDPNLQNIPEPARRMFVAPAGRVLIGADFSKVEPTILADFTGDEKFKQPFLDGTDIYSSLASGTFHIPIEQCGDGTKPRKMMKTGLLATMYGTSMFTLAKQLHISVEEAEQFIESFLNGYPVIGSWINGVHDFVNHEGYVTTRLGRKRRFIGHKQTAKRFREVEKKVVKILGRKPKNIWKEKLPHHLKKQYWAVSGDYFRVLRQAVNCIIQGTGAEVMKEALCAVYDLFNQWGSDYKILSTIHDEIIMEVPETITQEQVKQIETVMTNAMTFSLPLKVDVEMMHRWGDGIKAAQWFTERGQ